MTDLVQDEKFDSAPEPVLTEAAEIVEFWESNAETGLTEAEVESRKAKYGLNELKAPPKTPKWRVFLEQFNSPLIYLLFAAIFISILAWAFEGAKGLPVDAIVILLIVILNAIMGYVQENRAADAVAALQSMTRTMATVIRDGEQQEIPSAEVVPGDLLVLSEGDEVSADARLISASSLRIAEASLTGESVPVGKSPDVLPEMVALGDRKNMVFKGTAVTQGVGRAVVIGTGMNTEVGEIADMLAETETEPTPLSKELDQLGKLLGIAVLIIAVAVMIVVFSMASDHSINNFITVLILGVSLAVAAVPEGLPAILTVVLSLGVQRMAKRNAIVKDLSSVETLGSASVIASDKTGTLTRNEMTILKVITAQGETDIEGAGYIPEGRLITAAGEEISGNQLHEVALTLSGGAAANNAQLKQVDGQWQIQGDPTEAAFLVADQKLDDEVSLDDNFVRSGEVPFTSARKMMSVVGELENVGYVLFAKGAPDILLDVCTQQQIGQETVELTTGKREEILAKVEELASDAFRTMAVGYRKLDSDPGEKVDETWEENLVFVGIVAIIDPPRTEAADSIAEAHRAGIRVIMITGDHPSTAGRIASDLGIIEPGGRVITGPELDQMDEQELGEAVATTSVYARVAPKHKMQIINTLQAQGEIVSMTGDGVNDAPALKTADIGVSMGITGTEVTKESAKMILADDNFSTIVAAVREGRQIFENIRKFLRYLLSSNVGEVLTMFLGTILASTIGLYTINASGQMELEVPLLATQILWINLVTDSMPALAMGVDPAVEDLMDRKPRKLTDRVINKGMWIQMLWVGFVMSLVCLFVLDFYMPEGLVNVPHGFFNPAQDLRHAQTAAFTCLVFMQLMNAFNARSTAKSAFTSMFTNSWLWLSVVAGVVFQVIVVEVPFMQIAFGTTRLSWDQWLVCLVASSVVLWVEEIRKLIVRSSRKRTAEVTL